MSHNKSMNMSTEELLYDAHRTKVIELLPVIITMAVSGLLGILGNVVTIKFYVSKRRKTPTILLIISLAIVDLIVCVIIVPNIAEMCLNILYTSSIACKISHFIGHWFVESSGLVLGLIAIDRYRKICASSKRKITKATVKKAIGIIVVFSCLMSIRDFINFDIITVTLDRADNSSIIGHYCTTTTDPELKLSVLIFHLIDAVMVFAVLLTILFTYSSILWTVCKLKHIRNTETRVRDVQKQHAQPFDQSEREVAPRDTIVQSRNTIDKDVTPSNADEYPTIARLKKQAKTARRKIRRSEWNVTLLMMVVSISFLVCLVPYFVVKIGLRSVRRASDLELGLLTQFALRLVYINSVVNPIIYCLFNPSFRRHVRRLLSWRRRENVDDVTSGGTLDNWSTVARSRQHSLD